MYNTFDNDNYCSSKIFQKDQQSSLSSISQSSGTTCGRSNFEDHKSKLEVHGQCATTRIESERKIDFDELRNKDIESTNKVPTKQESNPCNLSFDTDATPKSGNRTSV